MNTLIVTEEASVASDLRALVKKTIPEIKEARITTDFNKVADLVRHLQPQLLFIDIGIVPKAEYNMFKRLPEDIRASLIILTEPEEKTLTAIRFSMLDHVLKPFAAANIRSAFDRLLAQPASIPAAQTMYSNLLRNILAKDNRELRLTLSSTEGTFFYRVEEIIRLEYEPPFTWFYFTNRRPLPVAQPLKLFEALLGEHGFLAVHKSYLVNKIHVVEFTPHGTITLSDRTQVEISRRRKEEMISALKNG